MMNTDTQNAEATVRNLEAAAANVDSRVRHEFENLVADLEDLIKATTTLTGEELEQARKQLAERVTTARRALQSMSDEALSRVRQTARITDEYVHDQPWKAMGVCASVGFLLGMLVSRR